MELEGQKYNKSAHRRALLNRLNKRTDAAVERKHQNISAALIELGVPYITGYKPLGNYQKAMGIAVTGYLVQHSDFHRLFAAHSLLVPSVPKVEDFLDAWCTPPERKPYKSAANEQRAQYGLKAMDYLSGEARNQLLGEAGEKFVLNFERARLIRAGKEALADRIEQVSVTVGPSAGFDIKSLKMTVRTALSKRKPLNTESTRLSTSRPTSCSFRQPMRNAIAYTGSISLVKRPDFSDCEDR
jgi:hypothetical protein